MVVVDRFTQMAHFIALEQNATARDVADVVLSEVWKLHGLPTEIILDINGKVLCRILGITLQIAQYKAKNVNRRPPSTRWTKRTD